MATGAAPQTVEVASTGGDQDKRQGFDPKKDCNEAEEDHVENIGASTSDDTDSSPSVDANGSENDTANGVDAESSSSSPVPVGEKASDQEVSTTEEIQGTPIEQVDNKVEDNDLPSEANGETKGNDKVTNGDAATVEAEPTVTVEMDLQENQTTSSKVSLPLTDELAENETEAKPTTETIDTFTEAQEANLPDQEPNTVEIPLSEVTDPIAKAHQMNLLDLEPFVEQRPVKDSLASPTKVILPALKPTANGAHSNNDSILLELQETLQHQMTVRAEVENKLRNQAAEIDEYKKKLEEFSTMEDKLEKLNANLIQVVTEKSQLEQEVGKLRDGRDDLERKEAVLSNRLNNAKKNEASKSNVAGKLEKENEELRKELYEIKGKLNNTTAQKEKLENSMEKLKKKCVERVKMAEAALVEERDLNEERKKKMKVFVETKAEELRSARSGNDELRAELKETSGALQSVRGKLEHITRQFDHSSTKNRELTREMNRMKKNSEQLHQLGGNLELELQKSAQETEEHKNKRLTAKHELMTILRKLEAEQAVSGKLRDSVKFTFTPKALSQQQILNESLQDFESELLKLSRRLGKSLPPSGGHGAFGDHEGASGSFDGEGSLEQALDNSKKKANSRSEWDTSRLLSSLEEETQQVSKGIMAFSNAVERMRSLLDTSGEKTCANTLNEIFGTLAASSANPRHLNGATALPTTSISQDDEDGAFTGSPVKGRSAERYDLVGEDL